MYMLLSGLPALNSSELEVVVLCKLEQATIASERHHASLAARIIVSALKLLQNSDVYKESKETFKRFVYCTF